MRYKSNLGNKTIEDFFFYKVLKLMTLISKLYLMSQTTRTILNFLMFDMMFFTVKL